MNEKMLPIGTDDFEKLRKNDLYYVDKTGLIKALLTDWGEVNLFTRPRRFGKSLNMSMLRYFFEIGGDKSVFDGLKIMEETELCERHMGRYPVIAMSLKGVSSLDYESARKAMNKIVAREAARHGYLADSDKLEEREKEKFKKLLNEGMDEGILADSLNEMSALLEKHHGVKTIILIDEYDVPLDKAFENRYYRQMVNLIRNMFGNALKTNNSLFMAVLTGCLRISKESIFTGLNNFRVYSVTNVINDEYFGFTDSEVRALLDYYNLGSHYGEAKKWYDGYRFGNVNVYCPWDIIYYCSDLRANPNAFAQAYWINTSGNGLVKRLVRKATKQTQKELETLCEGGEITKRVRQELTYDELEDTIENMWSVLFVTGYLTYNGTDDGRHYRLVIPNLEVREIFVLQIKEWFNHRVREDRPRLNALCAAFKNGEAERVEQMLTSYLVSTISIRDTFTSKKENFYHGVLLGLLSGEEDWYIESNVETGDGCGDIIAELEEERIGIIIELKYSDSIKMDGAASRALNQIKEKNYAERLYADGYETVIAYGIACFKKRCRVMTEKL